MFDLSVQKALCLTVGLYWLWMEAVALVPSRSELADQNFTAIEFLSDIKRLHGIDTVLIMHNSNASISGCFYMPHGNLSVGSTSSETGDFSKIMVDMLYLSVLQMTEHSNYYLRKYVSDTLITVVYIDGSMADHNGLLKSLASNLLHMRFTKILFLIDRLQFDKQLLLDIFKYSHRNKMINVAALFADYQMSETFYRFSSFPDMKMESVDIAVDHILRREIYPYRNGNLRGYHLRYIVGGSEPRIIVYKGSNGELVIGGFAGHLLQSFADKFNCKLEQPIPVKINVSVPSQELVAAVRNGTVDISAGLTFPSIPIVGYTYPYELSSWCIMLPVEPDIPNYKFFIIVFDSVTFILTMLVIVVISTVLSIALSQHGYKPDILDVILHDNCLRGALGQSFTEISNPPKVVRFIYLQICVLGILLTTWYNSYFATYVTSAPKEDPISNFDDILKLGKKLYMWTPEYNEVIGRGDEFKKYMTIFHSEPNYSKYIKMRDSYNTEYGYVLPNTKWVIVNEQQKIFTTPIFRMSGHMCFFNIIPMVFPVDENSLFMQSLNQLILETDQSGLTQYWQEKAFYELINAGKLSFADLSTKREFRAMRVDDLRYIWCGMGVMVVVVGVVFLVEKCVYYRARLFKCISKVIKIK